MTRRGLGRPFWVVFAAGAVSFLGDGITFGALPLLAYELTRDPQLISLTEVAANSGWLLLGLGLLAPFFDNASSAILPELVEPAALERANGYHQVSLLSLATLIGPPAGAALFVVHRGLPLAIDTRHRSPSPLGSAWCPRNCSAG